MLSRVFGLGLAATGAAHFAAPQAFESITAPIFPDDTDEWIKRNGAAEVAIGMLIFADRTRKLGYLGLIAYGAHLGSRMANASGAATEVGG